MWWLRAFVATWAMSHLRAYCRESRFVTNTRFFGFVLSRLLLRHLGFDSDFAQISEQKTGGWGLCMGQFAMEWSQDCDKNVPSYRGRAGVDLILPDRPQAAPSLLSYLSTLSGCKWDINVVTSMAMLTYSAVTLQSVGPIQNFTFRTAGPKLL